jgi:hypothetical protein
MVNLLSESCERLLSLVPVMPPLDRRFKAERDQQANGDCCNVD